jgi:peptide-methionine (S)-S-oxide reductase
MEKATFAAGCFWGVEDEFRKVPGVLNATVGYSGGRTQNPNYKEVCSGTTGHAEVCQVEFDSQKTSFEELVNLFFNMHDPTTLNRQGPDVGDQYRSAIFYHDETQKKKAEEIKEKLEAEGKFKRPIVTEIKLASDFHRAEEYHQKYFQKNGISHCHI